VKLYDCQRYERAIECLLYKPGAFPVSSWSVSLLIVHFKSVIVVNEAAIQEPSGSERPTPLQSFPENIGQIVDC